MVIGFTAVLLFLALVNGSRADQFNDLRLYWQSNLVNNGSSPASVASTATSYWSTLNTNATTYLWSDLPLGSLSRNLASTFDRLQAMALGWATPGSSVQGNANLAAAVANGLDWLNSKYYTTNTSRYDNWYHWEIGVPQSLNNTMVLLYPALTGTQITNYINAIDRFTPGGSQQPPGNWMTGANRADIALVVIIRGILAKSADKIALGQTNLSPVFPYVTSGDGFHNEGSFLFHTYFAYNGHYGLVLLGDVAKLVNLLRGSTWEITDPNLANVYGWVSNSFQPFIYNGAMMDMVRGRAISWSYSTEFNDGDFTISTVRQIAQFAPATTAAAFTNWANAPRMAAGQFHFPEMDRVVAWRTNFAIGISMCSSRIANYEAINGGNLHGWFTGSGMTYLYLGNKDTQFIGDFWATIDPYHLPGTTVTTNARPDAANQGARNSQNWVGGAQVSKTYGVTGMSIADTNTLIGRKSWFMFDNKIVCLGAGITCSDAPGVHTTVENRRLGLSPTNNFWVNGVKIPPVIGWSSNLTSASWCALDGVGGYYFPGGTTNLQASFTASSGSWVQVNNIDTTTVYTDDYLKLYFNHGIRPTNSTYAYVLLPNMNANSVSNYALAPDIFVLTNTANVQAVSQPALGVTAANFWTNGNSSTDLIAVNDKASVITWETSSNIMVGISDPTQTNKSSITVTLNRSALSLVSADSGVTVVQLTPQIILSVNVNGSRGKSYQATLQIPQAVINPPPVVALVSPMTNSVYLNSTNDTLFLSATASNTIPANPMTTVWSQTSGPGTVTFGDSNALSTTVNFSTNGIYGIAFTASNGAAANVALTVAVNAFNSPPTNGLLNWWKMDEVSGPTAFDSSGNGVNATVSGATFTTGYLSNALHLTAGNNNATFTSTDAMQITVAGWVKANSSGGTSFPYLLGNSGFHFVVRMDGSANNNTLDFATHTTAGSSTVNGEWVSPPGTIGTNAWYHVAFSYDKGSIANVPALYINGVKMSLTTLKSSSVATPTYAGTSYIGNRSDLIRGWDGWIDDLRIYNRILSDAEMQTLAGVAALPNLAPVVSAGANQTIAWPSLANLTGSVSDDNQPNPPSAVTLMWSKVSGPGAVVFANSNAMATAASFSALGDYQLQLTANDGQVTAVSSVTVTVVTRPNLSVQLLPGALQLSWPTNNGNWQLQYQTNSPTVGLSGNWMPVPGSSGIATTNIVIDPNQGAVFYRLIAP